MQISPIIVHQMGKVGSKTVELSLKKAYEAQGIQVPIYHTHILNSFEEVKRDVVQERYRQEVANAFATVNHGARVRQLIDEDPTQRWNVISLVRDLIARNISAFFESLPEYIPDWRERYAKGNLTMYEIQALFLKSNTAYETPDFWFDYEMKSFPAFGIDVYDTPFPHEIGYKIYPAVAQADLLLIRVENLKECGQRAMQEFLGLENFRLQNTNTADEKEYAAIYRAFVELPLPLKYVERMYTTRAAQHFYSTAELDTFTKRWTKSAELASDSSSAEKQLAEREKAIELLALHVAEKTKSVRALTAQLAQPNPEVEAIKASTAWKLTMFLRRIRIRLIPPNSLRAKVVDQLLNLTSFIKK